MTTACVTVEADLDGIVENTETFALRLNTTDTAFELPSDRLNLTIEDNSTGRLGYADRPCDLGSQLSLG